MRRWIVLFVGLGLVAAACAGGSTPSTSGPAATTSQPSEPTATAPVDAATASAGSSWPAADVLVINDEGVFQIDSHGVVTQLVKGQVAYAIDDTRGGLLFQVERGRSPAWWGEGSSVRDTRVWWIKRGSADPQELLIPTPGEPLDLTLHDSFVDAEGHTDVLYVRHDSTIGPDGDWSTFVDSLRIFDVDDATVTELDTVPRMEPFEAPSGSRSVVAVTFFGSELGFPTCHFYDSASGAPTQPSQPMTPEVACSETDSVCHGWCAVSPGGDWLAYVTSSLEAEGDTSVHVATPEEQIVLAVELEIEDLDLIPGHLIANRGSGSSAPRSAILFDLDTGDRTRVPVAGLARFVSAPVEILGPVVSPEREVVGLRSEEAWQRVKLPGAKWVAGVAPVGAGFFAIGTDADGLAGWITQAGLGWERVDVVSADESAQCRPQGVYSTGSVLVANVSCAPAEGSHQSVPQPRVSQDGRQWREALSPLRPVEIEPGAWQVISDWQLASKNGTVLVYGSPSVIFEPSTFLPRYIDGEVLDRMALAAGQADFIFADDGTATVVIHADRALIFQATFDELGVSIELLRASRRSEPHLWRSGPNLVFEELGSMSELGLHRFDELVGTPSGFYAMEYAWSSGTGSSTILRSHNGSSWLVQSQDEYDQLAGMVRYADGILIEGHTYNAPAIELRVFSPGSGWSSIELPERGGGLYHASTTAVVGSSGLIAGWSDSEYPGPHATQSPAYIRRGDVTLRVDRPAASGGPMFHISSNTTDQVLLEVFDPDDGSIVIAGGTVTFRNPNTGQSLFAIAVEDLLDGVCIPTPQTLWWSRSDATSRWDPHPEITGSRLVAANQHLVVTVDQESEGGLCQPLSELYPEWFADAEPTVWVGWVD